MNPNITVTACSPGSPSSTLYTIHVSDSEEVGKRRRKRTIISIEQLTKLESLYKQEQWPNRERKERLAKEIGMSTHFVNIWFQNKRSRMKKLAQEEAELASLRKSMSESESQQSQEDPSTSTSIMSIQSSENASATEQLLKTSVPSPARAGPKPILPASLKPTQSNFKTVLSDLKLTSPQVVCVKLPLTTAQTSASSPDQSAALKKIKLEGNPGRSYIQTGMTMNFQTSPVPVLPTESTEKQNMALTPELLQQESQTPGSIVSQKPLSSVETIQKMTLTQSHVMSPQHQPLTHKPPQIRFACSSSAVMPSSYYKVPPGADRNESIPLVSAQESSFGTQSISSTSHDSNQPISTASLSHDMNQPSSYNLFDYLVAMAAIEEGGGIVQKQDPIYDVAVNSALYGIKVEEDVVLSHDKQKGLRFAETES